MARIIVSQFVSLDGVVEAPEKWSLKYWNDEISAFKHAEMDACDALLLGRVTYEAFATMWPRRRGSDGYADRINAIPKFVASRTLGETTWNASVLGPDLGAEIRRVKERFEGDVIVFGSPTLMASLLELGLVDELRLITYPVVLGRGLRLFAEGTAARLERVEARPFPGGPILLTYRPLATAP